MARLIALLSGFAFAMMSANVVVEASAADGAAQERPMIEHVATGTFEVTLTPTGEAGAAITSMSIDKSFQGELSGHGVGQMLAIRTFENKAGGYVAMERVTGSLGGRQGSFALQHSGTMNRGAQSLTLSVVPDSGTDGLQGLAGSMSIEIAGGQHHYSFRYSLPE